MNGTVVSETAAFRGLVELLVVRGLTVQRAVATAREAREATGDGFAAYVVSLR